MPASIKYRGCKPSTAKVQYWARKKARELAKEGQVLEQEEEYLRLHQDKDTRRENFIECTRHELGLDMRPGQTGA